MSRPRDCWPPLLQKAASVLRPPTEFTEQDLICIMVACLRAAHSCAVQLGEIDRARFQNAVHARLQKSLKVISNCIARMPSGDRGHLDQRVAPIAKSRPIDLETIFEIFDLTRSVLKTVGHRESIRALDQMRISIENGHFVFGLQAELECMSAELRRSVEIALENLEENITASRLFSCIAGAMNVSVDSRSEMTAKFEYVKRIEDVWRMKGLKPSRIYNPNQPHLRSPFHQFADLLLTAIMEPQSRRHDDNRGALFESLYKAHLILPGDLKSVSNAPRRKDVRWLVSDYHVKLALA